MYALLFILVAIFLTGGCTEEKKYITQVVGPQDWRPPEVTWLSPPDAEVRGTIGLDVSVHDSSRVTEVRLYLDGREQDTLFTTPYRFEVVTDSLLDGVHLCEARAWDQYENLGISPVLRVNVANSIAQGPRVLWVPDSLAALQAAINAAQDFDTIRVRDGTYYETLNTFGKGIWIESEHGPLTTIVDGQQAQNTLFATASQQYLTVRGLTIRYGGGITVEFEDGSHFQFFNNVVEADSEAALLHAARTAGTIRNNLFEAEHICVEIWSLQGTMFNNIFQDATVAAMWNTNYGRNPVEYGYNLFWQNESDYYNFQPGLGDVHGDPLIDLIDGRLLPGSPAIDAGHPDERDRDGTRADIGPFGGPFAY
jgi:hypothetical protein